MASPFLVAAPPLGVGKFRDPELTAKGEPRAAVPPAGLDTLWFNTGTLCNLSCATCYIESSPRNDALVYISEAEVRAYLDEIVRLGLGTGEIGLTGGEPFMNREIIPIVELALSRGFDVLVLTNAMRPMRRWEVPLRELRDRYGHKLTFRVSLDHYTQAAHASCSA